MRMHAHNTHTHARAHTQTDNDCSKNWVLILDLVGAEIL